VLAGTLTSISQLISVWPLAPLLGKFVLELPLSQARKSMTTKEEQEALRLLVQHVSRGFYEPKFTIIMDQLARHPV